MTLTVEMAVDDCDRVFGNGMAMMKLIAILWVRCVNYTCKFVPESIPYAS